MDNIYKDIAAELANCVKVLTDIVNNHDLDPDETERLKYVLKSTQGATQQLADEQIKKHEYWLVHDSETIVGNINFKEMTLHMFTPVTGLYCIADIKDKGRLQGFDLIPDDGK